MLYYRRTCVYDLSYHLAFAIKYRRIIFIGSDKYNYMKLLLKQVCKKHHIIIQKYEVMPDHIHILISIPPKQSISTAVKSVKGYTARRWFMRYPSTRKLLYKGHLWSPSYFISTLGNMSKSVVEKYIENQYPNSNYIDPKWSGNSSWY